MPTLQEIAKAAGVSPSTVSRALRGVGRVSDGTRRRIIQTAEHMNFTLSRSASALASGKSMRVLIPFSSLLNSWFSSSCIQGIYEVFSVYGYDIVPIVTTTVQQLEKVINRLPNERNIDGLILPSIRLEERFSTILSSLSIPSVGLDARETHGLDATIMLDNEKAMFDAVQFLHNLGHTRIGYVAYPIASRFESSSQVRSSAFMSAAKQLGYGTDQIAMFPPLPDGETMSENDAIDTTTSRILRSGVRPTALCTEMDDLAIPLIFSLRAAGFRIPEDISIIGFDDTDRAALLNLTTLRQDPRIMARMPAEKLVALMNGDVPNERNTLVSAKLIPRSTTTLRRYQISE